MIQKTCTFYVCQLSVFIQVLFVAMVSSEDLCERGVSSTCNISLLYRYRNCQYEPIKLTNLVVYTSLKFVYSLSHLQTSTADAGRWNLNNYSFFPTKLGQWILITGGRNILTLSYKISLTTKTIELFIIPKAKLNTYKICEVDRQVKSTGTYSRTTFTQNIYRQKVIHDTKGN